jgi:hypothetical protein
VYSPNISTAGQKDHKTSAFTEKSHNINGLESIGCV